MSDKIKPRIEGDGSAWCDENCPRYGYGHGCSDARHGDYCDPYAREQWGELEEENARLKAELDQLKDALVTAIGSPKDRDRMHEAIPCVMASYRDRGEKAEAKLEAVREWSNEWVENADFRPEGRWHEGYLAAEAAIRELMGTLHDTGTKKN